MALRRVLRGAVRRGKRLGRAALGKDIMQSRQVRVRTEVHGSLNAQWVICPSEMDEDSVIYSFGVGKDLSFDTSIIDRLGVTVHAFDPTPKSVKWITEQELPHGLRFHPFGVAAVDGVATFVAPRNPNHVSFSVLGNDMTHPNTASRRPFTESPRSWIALDTTTLMS